MSGFAHFMICAAILSATTAVATPIKIASVSASSSFPPERGVTYEARQVADGKQGSAWVEGDSGSGLGSWVEVDLGSEKHLDRMKIWGGLWYSPEYWARANRPKDLEIKFSDGSVEMVTLDDEMVAQTVSFEHSVTTSTVRVRVKSIYKGSTWHDTAISEMQFFDAKSGSDAEVTGASSSSQAETDRDGSYAVENAYDGVTDSMWCEGDAGDGTGEWLKFDFPSTRTISSLNFVNGVGSSFAIWMKANRSKSLTLSFSNGAKTTVKVRNVMLPQTVTFDPVETSYVKVTINEVLKGAKYNDLCISEASFKD
jgi:hypothetical protein